MIFPFLDSNIESVATDNLDIFKEIAWDFTTDTPIIEQNEFKIVEGAEALKVWIYKAIRTVRFEHDIYSWDYGCEMTNLIGKEFSRELAISEVRRYIEEALMINEYIEEVSSIDIEFVNDELKVEVYIDTYYGEVNVNV